MKALTEGDSHNDLFRLKLVHPALFSEQQTLYQQPDK